MDSNSFAEEQRKDNSIRLLVEYLEARVLPEDSQSSHKVVSQAPSFTLVNRILYFIDVKQGNVQQIAVLYHLTQQIMTEYHSSIRSGHFSGARLCNTLCKCWYWEGMYTDCLNHAKSCPQCAVAKGTGRRILPSLKPIPVSQVFQIVAVNIMELPKTQRGNKYVVVFQDFLSKWPMVFPVADQKAITLVKLLVEEAVPFISVLETLLSDRGTNLLFTLMLDVCEKLGIKKLNTTAYHPQCNNLVEHFKRMLKTMLRKQAMTYGTQWISSYQELCGHIVKPHTRPQGRNPHFCYLVWTVMPHYRQHCFLLPNQSQLKSSPTIDKSWLCHYHLQGKKQ